MNATSIIDYCSYALMSSMSPGPNNMALSVSSTQFGLKKTVPQLLGIFLGFGTLLFACNYGLTSIIESTSYLLTILKLIGTAYFIYLLLSIVRKTEKISNQAEQKSISFYQAYFFQFVNPKGVLMAITATSMSITIGKALNYPPIILPLLFSLINLISAFCWASFGLIINNSLINYKSAFNSVFFLLSIYSIFLIWN